MKDSKWVAGREQTEVRHVKGRLEEKRQRSKTWKVELGWEQTDVRQGKCSMERNRQK